LLGALGIGLAPAREAAAQYPNGQPTRMLVGFPPGGSVDILARLVVEQMRDRAPQLIVENRAGAGGRLALEALRHSPPDGQTLLLTPSDPITFSPHVRRTTLYRAMEDYVPVAMVAAAPFIIAVGPAVPADVTSVDQFAAFCRARPRIATFGTPGSGSRPHFIGAMLAKSERFEFTHVPYNGAAAAIQDMIRGEIAASVTTIANILPHIQAGTARALVTTGRRRNTALPSTPTIGEAGHPDLEVIEWFGIMAPPKTTPAILEISRAAAEQAIGSEAFRKGLMALSFEAETGDPGGLAAAIQAETERWGAIIQASGFAP